MDKERQRAAKQQIALLMEQGTSWKEATATVGVHISRSTASALARSLARPQRRRVAGWQAWPPSKAARSSLDVF